MDNISYTNGNKPLDNLYNPLYFFEKMLCTLPAGANTVTIFGQSICKTRFWKTDIHQWTKC